MDASSGVELSRRRLGSLARAGAAAVCTRNCEAAVSVFALVDLTRLDVEVGRVVDDIAMALTRLDVEVGRVVDDIAMATVGVVVVRTGCVRGMLMERQRPSLSSFSSGWVSEERASKHIIIHVPMKVIQAKLNPQTILIHTIRASTNSF